MLRPPTVFFVLLAILAARQTCAQSVEADTIVAFLVNSLKGPTKTPAISPRQLQIKDSLERVMSNAKNDSIRASTLILLGDFYLSDARDFNQASKVYDSVLYYAAKLQGTSFASDALWGIGLTYYDQGNYLPSINAFEEANAALESSGQSRERITMLQARVLVNLGALYTLINEWEEGQQYYFRSITKLEEVKDTTSLATTYYNISFLFSDMNDWEKGYEYIKKSLVYRPATPKNYYQSMMNDCRMAYICVQLERMSEASKYMEMADKEIGLYENLTGHHKHLVYLSYYSAKGMYDHAKGRNTLATQYLLRAYREAVLYEDPYWVAVQARELALLYFHTGNMSEAKNFFLIGLNVAKSFNYKPQVLSIYSDLSVFEKAQGNLEGALTYRDKEYVYYDSLVKLQNHSRVLLNEAKFQTERRQNEILQLKKDNQIQALKARQNDIVIYALIVISAMIIFSAIITYRNLKQKQNLLEQNEKLQVQKINQLENEKQLMASEAVIKGQEEERGRLAKDLHDGLGGLLSGVKFSLTNMKSNVILNAESSLMFERSLDMLDHSISELRRVAHNMMPEVLIKFGLTEALKSYCDALIHAQILAINYQVIGLKERLPSNVEIILYRIIQELLNNAIKHAKAKHVVLQLAQHEKELNITLEDNGIGFDINNLPKASGSGLGNIHSRVEYLKGKLDIQTAVGKGTSVLITFATT